MLLGIAGANATQGWVSTQGASMARDYGGVYGDSLWDRIAVVVGCLFFHVRGLPMFSTLLGIGFGMITVSLMRRGYPRSAARRLLIRRYGFLALFGVVHTVFLFWGDIMCFYGLAGILLALMIGFRDKVLLLLGSLVWVVSLVLTVIASLIPDPDVGGDASSFFGSAGDVSLTTHSYLGQVGGGLAIALAQVISFPMEVVLLGLPIVLGYLAAKRGIIHNIQAHRKLLWAWVIVALLVILCVGLPLGLAQIGVIGGAAQWEMLNQSFGVLTGPGIVAGLALALDPLQRRAARSEARGEHPRIPRALWPFAALGKRSMSGYVGQSVLFSILVTSYGLGLTRDSGAWKVTLMAILVWFLTLLGACLCEALGKPGPLEWLHRHLAYGRQGLPPRYEGPVEPPVGERALVYPGNESP